jgi:hypothetical protein
MNMATFSEANQARLSLKMKLSQYSWYSSSAVVTATDGYSITVSVKVLDNRVRKLIPPVIEGVSVKTEVE